MHELPKVEKKADVFYGNAKCVATGEKTDPKLFVEYADPKTHVYGKIYMCCLACKAAIEKDPAAAYKKAYLDREIKDKDGKVIVEKGQPIDLKNEKCPIMGGKVSDKDWAVYNGYRIHFCCPACEKPFMKDADKNLAKLIKDQKVSVLGLPEPSATAEKAEPMKM
jgi:hypothetical protein